MSLQQQRSPSYLHFFFIGISIYTILPFLLLHIYNHPSADDFSFAVRDRQMGYISVLKQYYMNWTGRYFSTISLFRINPTLYESLNIYRIYSLVNMLLLVISTFMFTRIVFKRYLASLQIVVITAVLLCLYLLLMPSTSEGLYFFATYATYQFPNTLILIMLGLVYALFHSVKASSRRSCTGIACILIIAIVGSNEMSLIMVFMTCLLLLVANRNNHIHRSYLLFLFMICTISCLVAVLAPGNYARMNDHPNASRIIWSTVYAGFLTLLTFYRWLIPVLIASLIYMLFIGLPLANKTKNSRLFSIDLRLAVLYFLATIFLMYFTFAWSTGERATPRVENVICFFFVFGWFYVLQVALHTHSHRLQHERLLSPIIPAVAMLLFLLNLLAVENNISTAYVDLVSGKAAAYDEALKRRYAAMAASDCQECTVDPLPAIPKSIYFMDILEGPENNDFWVNRGFADYWGKDAVHLSARNPPITDNLSTLRKSSKNSLREKSMME